MRKLIKFAIFVIIILLIFSVLPEHFWQKIKPFFDWDKFFNTLKTGFNNLVNFIENIIGIDFATLPEKIKNIFGIDLIKLWQVLKSFLAKIFEKLANLFK